jgi:ABC-type antimicrobial peptide transport system permease subunit
MALGAKARQILGMIVRQGLLLVSIGVLAGLMAALGLTRLLGRFLVGVSASDPLLFATTAVLLGGVALAACYIPARRATRVDPISALRVE